MKPGTPSDYDTIDLPTELGHGVGQAEHAGADHGGDIVEGGVPPLGLPRRRDGEPVVNGLLVLRLHGGGRWCHRRHKI
jgi:hypothetical protein